MNYFFFILKIIKNYHFFTVKKRFISGHSCAIITKKNFNKRFIIVRAFYETRNENKNKPKAETYGTFIKNNFFIRKIMIIVFLFIIIIIFFRWSTVWICIFYWIFIFIILFIIIIINSILTIYFFYKKFFFIYFFFSYRNSIWYKVDTISMNCFKIIILPTANYTTGKKAY